MLESLKIKDFAIIQKLTLEFNQGMTVLTGETGAGKSIIIDAVGLLAGGRGSSEFVRYGSKKCVLEGQFSYKRSAALTALLERNAIEEEDQTLLVQREIFATGRNVCRINGSMVTIAVLKEIGMRLIDIHGQNEHQELMVPENHIHLLDQFGPAELSSKKEAYRSVFAEYRQLEKERRNWHDNEQELAQRLDILKYQVEEIKAANLKVNEEEELKEEEQKLSNHQTIVEALSLSYAALQGEESSGLDLVGRAMENMDSIAEMDDTFKQISETISAAFFQLQEASSDLYREMDHLEYDEGRLNDIEERLNYIQQLKRKYGPSVETILAHYDQARQELDKIENREEQVDMLSKKTAQLEKEAKKLAEDLTELRKQTAVKLESAILDQLKELYMEKAQFSVVFKKAKSEPETGNALTEMGQDKIEFYVSTNPGEPLKPLARVASGGELSRLMLAVKTLFSNAQGITSIIFDEVDTGVSGRVAQAIADKIYSVARHSQVLCITHLPQVAATADQHLYIQKDTDGERTSTRVEQLAESKRTEEIARMLSGDELTQLTLETASELLKLAKRKKK
ncbi:DNA repair protein RecN [Alkalibacterium sp. AK22]|uniref:DNA repair protein RecN n=1 Tax=Alkalibacterium sp. AK22 TaxID=1229520 RepID=UPI000452032A|nr:DNA repair protein RecN [Alkalibacterium sp. AK22]EXJ22762.1 DNA repair protein RecN [Alkalibacterium sp. AK22]